MKTLCMTGAFRADLTMVAQQFEHAGMRQAQPSRQDSSLTFTAWHDRLLATMAGNAADNTGDLQPGKLWEQLASGIFLANMDAPCWGWADPRSVWLLDFWAQYETNIHFVLVAASPARALASALDDADNAIHSVSAVLQAWQAHHKAMLRFHHRHPHRSILVDADECRLAPAALISECNRKWNLPLHAGAAQAGASTQPDELALYLATALLADHPEIHALHNEIRASICALRPTDSSPDYSVTNAVNAYRARQQESAAVTARAVQQREQVVVELHQTQAELERVFIESRKTAAQLAQLQATIAERDGAIHRLSASIAEHTQCIAEREDTIRGLSASLHEHAQRPVEDPEKLRELWAENFKLEQVRNQLMGELAIKEREVEAYRMDLGQARQASSDAQQEKDLVALQLLQVQDELERHFLQLKEAQAERKKSEARLKRTLERNPDYCDYALLELAADPRTGDAQTLQWRVADLNAGGRWFRNMRFATTVDGHGLAFSFNKSHGAAGESLLRWPATGGEVVSVESPTQASSAANDDVCRAIASSDWRLLLSLCQVLGTPDAERAASAAMGGQGTSLLSAVAAARTAFVAFPPVFRYDEVTLKREQCNPDYEHLWIHLKNASFGAQQWPDIEFRISCANVRPNHFGSHPKLEFPAMAGLPLLENWFVESYDDFGEKLELRFALPDAMDIAVWGKLSTRDHLLVASLIERLPSILAALKARVPALRRDWGQWVELATNVKHVLELRTQAARPAQRHPEAIVAAPEQTPDADGAAAAPAMPASPAARQPAKPKTQKHSRASK